MRLLITADAVGGVWTHVQALVRAFGPAVECTVAVLGPAAPPPLRPRRGARVHHFSCRLEWMATPWADVRASGAWLQRLARDVRPDVVHVNGYAHAALGFDAPVLVGAHSCVCSWWRAVHGTAAPGEWDTYRVMVQRGLRAASLVVAPTAAMLQMLEFEHGPLSSGAVIHNGAASARTTAEKDALILSVGRFWDEAKNLRVLDAVAPALPWPVAVLGPTQGPTGAVSVPAHVEALGTHAARGVRQWMERASIYAHPARYEPFGLAVLEAAQAGCALVLADIASLREIWGPSAIYVPPDDEPAWRHALQALIAEPARLGALARAARRRARRYSAGRMARAYARAYAQLAGRPVDPSMPRAAGCGLQQGAAS